MKERFEQTNQEMLEMMTDSSPKFMWSQALRSFAVHMIFMNLWLLGVPFMLLLGYNVKFLKNFGFLPSSTNGRIFFVIQTIMSFGYIGTYMSYLHNRFWTDEDTPKLSAVPLAVVVCLTITRFFIISVRHGLSPANYMLRTSESPIKKPDINEALMAAAWIRVEPDAVYVEIQRSCVRLQLDEEQLRIKTLAHVYPLLRDRLIDKNHFTKTGLNMAGIRKEETRVNKAI